MARHGARRTRGHDDKHVQRPAPPPPTDAPRAPPRKPLLYRPPNAAVVTMPAVEPDIHDALMAILKRRGYLQPSYEIYGGVAGFFDYGPLGAGLKTNLESVWRDLYVVREGMAEIQCPNVSPEQVFKASGHLDKFADTLVECPNCHAGHRADHLLKSEYQRFTTLMDGAFAKAKVDADAGSVPADVAKFYERHAMNADQDPGPENISRLLGLAGEPERMDGSHGDIEVQASSRSITVSVGGKTLAEAQVQCPACKTTLEGGGLKVYPFNLMFRTSIGPGSGRTGYMRPETAQGMFMDFPWLHRYFREELPFGAVQLGRAYRNEISPRQSLLRLREFNQMEAEVFFDPRDKSWPRYAELEDRELRLWTHDKQDEGSEELVTMTMGAAVDAGIIGNAALGYFIATTHEYLTSIGIADAKLRFRQHLKTEKAHYSSDTWDAEFLSPRFGWVEIVGIADRTDYDLNAHMRVSGTDMRVNRKFAEAQEVDVELFEPDFAKLGPLFRGKARDVGEAVKALDPATTPHADGITVTVDGEEVTLGPELFSVRRERKTVHEGDPYVPHVVEPSYGVDRILYATLEGAYDTSGDWDVLRLRAKVAPVKAGVFPLMTRDGLGEKAKAIERSLRQGGLVAFYDAGGSIGRRYARADEVGIPFCITVDYDTLEADTVTIRERDSQAQRRVAVADLPSILADLVAERKGIADFGVAVEAPVEE